MRNLILVVLFCCLLLGPMAMNVAMKMGCVIPNWMLDARLEYLEGGESTVNVEEHLDFERFASGELQEAIETDMGNNIPFKSNVLLANATAQRACIEVSNVLFDWDCYPTYFGSERLYDIASDSLYRFPYDNTTDSEEQFTVFFEYMDEIASAYPDKQFYVYFVDISRCASSNPALRLVGYEPLEVDGYVEWANSVTNSSNLVYTGDEIDDSGDYHDYYYSTDHHWNGFGTKRAYERIAQVAGLDIRANPFEEVTTFNNLRLNGSDARLGLMLLDEQAKEPIFDFSNTKVTEGDFAPVLSSDIGFSESEPLKAEFDFYRAWFGGALLTLENVQKEGSVLLIGDSYTYSLRWLLSNACNKVVQRNDFTEGLPDYLRENDRTLYDRIDFTNPDKVIMVAAPGDFTYMLEDFEGYFQK